MKLNEIPEYQVSGHVSLRAPIKVLTNGIAVAAILAVIYAVVIFYNPLTYLSFIATLLFGALIGFVAYYCAGQGDSRSLVFNRFSALVLAVFALWAH